MNRILNFRVRQLCDTMESLHQRVRTMLASEIGLAVRDAIQDRLETVRKKQAPPRVQVKAPPKIDSQTAMQIAQVVLYLGSWYLRRYGPLWSTVGLLTASQLTRPNK
ncbi:MAG: hypothetical protein R3B84_16265 [Zavarzinella sp.]